MARDETIKAVQAALEHDPAINLHRYPIQVVHDGGVRLRGTVADVAAKRHAVHVAQRAAGGEGVFDELRVEVGVARGEDELRQAVVDTLKREPAFVEFRIAEGEHEPEADGTDRIAVAVAGARVLLRGSVSSLARWRLAQVLAWWVPGVADVDNRIRVGPGETDSDGELADAVRLALEKDPSLPAGQIDVTVDRGRVRLSGAVDSDEQSRLAALDCWYIPGVVGVDDRLAVKTP